MYHKTSWLKFISKKSFFGNFSQYCFLSCFRKHKRKNGFIIVFDFMGKQFSENGKHIFYVFFKKKWVVFNNFS